MIEGQIKQYKKRKIRKKLDNKNYWKKSQGEIENMFI